MNVVNVSEEYVLADYYLSNLRDYNRQKDRLYFNENVNRLAQILTWEFSKIIEYKKEYVSTPFSSYERLVPASSMIPCEKTAFCTCEKDTKGVRNAILSEELTCENKVLVITESLMTSASSLLSCLREVIKRGRPSNIVVLNLLSTRLAIENIEKFGIDIKLNIVLYTCGIDDFTPGIKGTIPGLGDVGDLLYGLKK